MKKFFKAAVALVAVVILACAFAGCTANVSGKTYVFDEVKIVIPDDASETEKTIANTLKTGMEKTMSSVEVTFNEDGTVSGKGSISTGTWEQDGKTVTVKAASVTTTLTVNGSKLEQGMKESGYELKVIYKTK